MKGKGIPLHPLSIRIWHWANALIILVLIITGAQLRITDIRIFSDYNFVVALHKYAGYFLTVSFLFWLAVYMMEWGLGGLVRNYVVFPKDLRSMPSQAAYYSFLYFRGKPNPFKPSREVKFNALQKMAYSFTMLIAMPVVIITGILFGNIMDFYGAILFFGGIRVIDAVHVIAGYFFVIYLIVHIYMATLGTHVTSHTKAMITGYEEE